MRSQVFLGAWSERSRPPMVTWSATLYEPFHPWRPSPEAAALRLRLDDFARSRQSLPVLV